MQVRLAANYNMKFAEIQLGQQQDTLQTAATVVADQTLIHK